MDDDSEDDDDDSDHPLAKMEDVDDRVIKTHLGPEDARVAGELQAGIDRIRVSLNPPIGDPTSCTCVLILTVSSAA